VTLDRRGSACSDTADGRSVGSEPPSAARAGDRLLVLICNEGYQSSLAAATVQRFGSRPVADVIGGFQAWRAAGLPVETEGAPSRAR
jgi:rhodanese-related sulfurtransferase